MSKYEINKELAELLPKLSQLEYEQLEANMLEDGRVLDPIIVWGQYVIDGMNRYKIAEKHSLKYDVREIKLANMEEAKEWVINHQLGKRNLNDHNATRLRVEKAKMCGEKEAAAQTGVTPRTIFRDMAVERAKESLPADIRKKVDSGKLIASKKDLTEYGKLSEEEKVEVNEKLKRHPGITLHQAIPKSEVSLTAADFEKINQNIALTAAQKRSLSTGTKHASPKGLNAFLALKDTDQEIVSEILNDPEIDSLDDAVRTFKAGKNPASSDITVKENRIHGSLKKKLEECLRLADDLKSVKKDKSGHNALIDSIKEAIRKLAAWK